MTNRLQLPHRRRGHAALVITLGFLVAGAFVLWAWNSIAIELFGAPAIGFKHVVALQAAIAGLIALPLIVVRTLRED